MLYLHLEKQVPRRNRPIEMKKPKKPSVVTISLVHPPQSYRSIMRGKKILKLFI